MWDISVLNNDFFYIFYLFFIYSFIGWIYESTYVSVKKKAFINRGFLNGPVIPIYGTGALLFYLALWQTKDNILHTFFMGALLATVLEYLTSLIMEALFHTKWWDYSRYRFNIKGRICLVASVLWGFFSILMLRVIHPKIDLIIYKIPRNMGEILGYIIAAIFLADFIVTVISTVKFDRLLDRVHKLRQELMDYIRTSRLLEYKDEKLEKLSMLRLSNIIKELSAAKESKLKATRIYQTLVIKKNHIRILKAFPTMVAGKRNMALLDLREKVFKKKGVLALSKDIKEEVKGNIKMYVSGILRAIFAGILVLMQAGVIIYLSLKLRGNTVYIYSFLQVISVLIILGLVNDDRNVSYKIGWICIIAAFPVTGHIMFLLWGNRRGKKIDKIVLSKLAKGYDYLKQDPDVVKDFEKQYPDMLRMTTYLQNNHFPLYKNNQVEYYPMAEEAFEAIFEEIKKAKKFILVNFFIIGEGALWSRMHDALLSKIKEGVRVLFLYDDFGAILRTPRSFKRDLEKEGFEVRVFNPIHKYTDKLYMNYRTHQKIVVVDGNVGFTGGMNLADEYVNLVPRFGVWKDNAVKITGDAVWGLTVTFLQMWEASDSSKPVNYEEFMPTESFPDSDVFCQVISDGPANNPRNPIEDFYKQMIYQAKKVLYITTPYLIIEDDMRDALITAAAGGVDVRIITPFIPDKKNVKILTYYNYGRLLKGGVRIFEYKPGFIHAKTMLNEASAVVGTINMDYRSFHLQYECGVWICNKGVVETIKEDLLKTMEECHEVTLEEWKKRPLIIKIYEKLLNVFSTLM
ncbi:MAG TPA: cardiolipin synthase [Mobilitalea sp.]|nr:cardiolipin synthase [Mobilitalea sp.]